jgi:hypothetical protein
LSLSSQIFFSFISNVWWNSFNFFFHFTCYTF